MSDDVGHDLLEFPIAILAHDSERALRPDDELRFDRLPDIRDAIWIRTPQGNLQLQYHINSLNVGLDRFPNSREMHGELLKMAIASGQPKLVPPKSSPGRPPGLHG